MRARYCDPDKKRFINQDVLTGSITNSKSLNRYSYVEGNPVSYTDPFGLSPYTYANALGRLNGVVQGIGNMLSNVNWSTVLHAGLDILGSLPGGSVFNIANAALYGLEGNKEEAVKSLIYAIPGADLLGKATNYAVKGGKYAKEVLALAELATYAGYEVSAMLAAGDFGNDIAGMIDKYMTGEADLSIRTAEELLSLFGHAFQLNNFSSGFINVPQADFSVIPEGKYEVKFADTDSMVMDGALGDVAGDGSNYNQYYNLDGSPIWPENRGFDGVISTITLTPGTRVDRFGYDGGTFVSPEGTPYTNRSLPVGTDAKPYTVFEIVKPIEVQAGKIAPWFGETGGGIQYEFSSPISELINAGILRKVEN